MNGTDRGIVKTRPPSDWTRREVLKVSGAALATVASGPLLAACAPFGKSSSSGPTEIKFISANFGSPVDSLVKAYNASQSKVHVTYAPLPPPSSSTEVHQQLNQQLALSSGGADVFTQDVIWIAEFADKGWAMPLDSVFGSEKAKFFPGVVQACTWKNQLTAAPWFVDSGMLYYRTDIVQQAPTTWADLTAAAQAAMSGKKAQFGFLWQGKQAEVLVCDAVEFIGSNGGSMLEPDGKTVSIANPAAVEAVQYMYDTIHKSNISPADVVSWDEAPSEAPFLGGNVAFERNWSFVWTDAQKPDKSQVVGKVAVAPLPHFPGGQSAAALGGYQLGVNAVSKNKDAALDFVHWLTQPAAQLQFATEGGFAPSRAEVYDDPTLAQKNPFMVKLKSVFTGATGRPVTPKYAQVSLVLQSQLSKAISNGNVQAELQSAKSQISAIVSA